MQHTNEGHRKRMKDRFLAEGLDNFEEVHALELLLYYGIARKDTKPIARMLMDQFGSFPRVLEATPEELQQIAGVGENVATFLKLVLAAGRYYQVKRAQYDFPLVKQEEYGKYLQGIFHGKTNETVYLLCLDAKCKVLCCKKVGEGDVNSANIPIRKMVQIALSVNATSVILAHNHPSGVAVPSVEDRITTERLAQALGAIDIVLADHIIVADGDYISMVASELYRPGEYCFYN